MRNLWPFLVLAVVALALVLDWRLGLVLALWLGAWLFNAGLAEGRAPWRRYAVPAIFGIAVLALWEMAVALYAISPVILPAPSAIWARMTASVPTLWADFVQTFVKGALSGYVIGCGAAVLTAIAIDRSPFLQRGLLPVGN